MKGLTKAIVWVTVLGAIAAIGWLAVQVWLTPRDRSTTDAGDLLDHARDQLAEIAGILPDDADDNVDDDENDGDDHAAADDEAHEDDDDDADDDDEAPGAVAIIDGVARLVMDVETQVRSGVATMPVAAIRLVPEIAALATVIDPAPLAVARDRYVAAAYDAEIIERQAAALRQEYDRLQALYNDDANIALKTVRRAEAAWQTEQARLRRAWAVLHAQRGQIEFAWGAVLTGWALAKNNPAFARLTRRDEVLLRVTLPAGVILPAGIDRIHVDPDGDRAAARPAAYVSPAIAADPALPGETHVFRTAGDGLRAGMRLDAWIAEPGRPVDGAEVPLDAVVWSIDQAWAYVQVADDQFERRAVTTDRPTPGGWLVTERFAPGDRIVVAGAQMLFAEEFRWQIRDEDDD